MDGEATAVAAALSAIAGAFAAAAVYYSRAAAHGGASRGTKPPRLDRKATLSLLENCARNADAALVRYHGRARPQRGGAVEGAVGAG